MASERLILLAESCSALRASIGRMLLADRGSVEHAAAAEGYDQALRDLLRHARQEELAVYLEVAGDV
jgi:uncharacterized protein YbgA (DUF1722 family)